MPTVHSFASGGSIEIRETKGDARFHRFAIGAKVVSSSSESKGRKSRRLVNVRVGEQLPFLFFPLSDLLFRLLFIPRSLSTDSRKERKGVEEGGGRARKKAARGTAKGRKCDLSQNSRARCHLDDDCRFDRSPIDCVYLDLARCYYWDGISFTVRATRILELVEYRMMNSRKVV